MAERIQQVRPVRDEPEAVRTTEVVEDPVDPRVVDTPNLAARIVWYIAGVLLALLAIRFILALLGANRANGFANFIYTTSHPFVAPFFSLFNYDLRYNVAHFESYTLVAMAVYALVAYGIAKLVTINRRRY